MSSQDDIYALQEGVSSLSRRQILKASASLTALPLLAVAASGAVAAESQDAPGAADAKSDDFINGMADLMAHSTRTPVLRWPNEYGMDYAIR